MTVTGMPNGRNPDTGPVSVVLETACPERERRKALAHVPFDAVRVHRITWTRT